MTVEQMCCTPDQSKRFLDLGVEQKSYFYHTTLPSCIHLEYLPMNPKDSSDVIGAAFNVAELGMMLPTGFDTMRVTEINGEYFRGYDNTGNDYPDQQCFKTEAEKRAQMIIALLETFEITPSEINVRLKN